MKKKQQIEDLKRCLNDERVWRLDAETRVRILREEVKFLNHSIDVMTGRVKQSMATGEDITILRKIS